MMISINFYYDANGLRVAKYRDAGSIDAIIGGNACAERQDKCDAYNLYGSKGTYYIRDANGELLSIYEGMPTMYFGLQSCEGYIHQSEQEIYGSESHGKFASKIDAVPIPYSTNLRTTQLTTDYRSIGEKFYDLKDHLGNVRLTLNDYKLRQNVNPPTGFDPSASSLTNFYPFGMEQQDRSANSGTTRFGYNGMLKDNEKGEGNSYTTEFRAYDPRIGRWWSLDPEKDEDDLVGWSGYHSFHNNPIRFNDVDGNSDWDKIKGGFAAFLDNNSLGLINLRGWMSYDDPHDYNLGQDIGDVASILSGTMEGAIGQGIVEGGVTAASTGIAAELPSGGTSSVLVAGGGAAIAGGTVLVAHGGATAVNGTANLTSKKGRVPENKPKIEKTTDDNIVDAVKTEKVHGNSKKSQKVQHGYAIKKKGKIQEYGISGQDLNKNGTSPRIQQKLNTKYKGQTDVEGKILKKGIPDRQKSLKWENNSTKSYHKKYGKNPPMQKRPKIDK